MEVSVKAMLQLVIGTASGWLEREAVLKVPGQKTGRTRMTYKSFLFSRRVFRWSFLTYFSPRVDFSHSLAIG